MYPIVDSIKNAEDWKACPNLLIRRMFSSLKSLSREMNKWNFGELQFKSTAQFEVCMAVAHNNTDV